MPFASILRELRRKNGYTQEKQDALAKLFNPFKVEPIQIDTAAPTADPVIAFFKQRAKKVRK